ncbi:hypothetical protein KDA_04340 [Dictyobacter alpinus]|uniref:Uncharacterized protein n=1 Tax=Dictyobacter alpinus TaxID=2014873 RepID=A0A402B0S3_9CHLR|nr:hypothetical protein [Dictyobacter alpinus]GCE24950.1 hypothetical protein KDA_04340 [Dictyobacter alpinus]
MTERYLPVPVWNNFIGKWEPVDFRRGQRVVNWPTDFDTTLLPVPEYSDGDRVQFVRDETCAREGVVRRVLLAGGEYRPLESRETAIKRLYLDPENMLYIVTARGHDHRIKAWNILGRFVSLERISSVLPMRE